MADKWIQLLYSAILFLAGKDAGNVTKGVVGVGSGMEASLLSQDPVYPPLTTPFFDLLTAADGKDMSPKL